MPFYLRKAVSVGPMRFNLSKSGIGVSVGMRGLRVGTGPRGNYIHAGRGGLYYRKTLGTPARRAPRSENTKTVDVGDSSVGAFVPIENAVTTELVDVQSTDLIDELNEKRKRFSYFSPAIIGAGLVLWALLANSLVGLAVLWLFLAAGIAWWVRIQDHLRRTTVVLYELEPDVESAYDALHAELDGLRGCSSVWRLEARASVNDPKYHAGANSLLQRSNAQLRLGQPLLLRANIEIPYVTAGKVTLGFMPEQILVFDTAGVGAVGYEALGIAVESSHFIETGSLPLDATVVGTTWQYVNRSGGPDRRFKNNRTLPACAYTEITFASAAGLNLHLQFSKSGVGRDLQTRVLGMVRALST